jgi:NOL1/NOP2/fmu family ribosome biogenesis protein
MKKEWIDKVKKIMSDPERLSEIEVKVNAAENVTLAEFELTEEQEQALEEGKDIEIPESTKENKVITFGSQESSSRSEIEEE